MHFSHNCNRSLSVRGDKCPLLALMSLEFKYSLKWPCAPGTIEHSERGVTFERALPNASLDATFFNT